jgi:predicted nucleic acid-binding protein
MAPLALFDSSAIDAFLKGVEPGAGTLDDHLRARRAATSAIVELEVWCGLRTEKARSEFRKVLRGMRGRIFPLDSAAAQRAAGLYRATSPQLGGPADYLIAATALLRRVPVITGNVKHFRAFIEHGLVVRDLTGERRS